ncbi:MAG: MCE family protein [Desulfobacterales bacterium]|nr:MAG: MCE family protein [Desulfobacterales bacterium]
MSVNLQKKRFRYTNETVGLLVLLAIIIFLAAFFQASLVQDWFDPGADIKIMLPEDGLFGLSQGANVEILGTKAGQVTRIEINPNQKMHAEVHIRSAMQPFVRSDSLAIIRKQFSVAGDSYLEITRGYGAPLDWKYAVLTAQADRAPTETMGKLIGELRTKIIPLIDDGQQAILAFLALARELQNPDRELQQLLRNVKSITGKIDRGEGAVGRLVGDDALMRDLDALLESVNSNVKRLGPILEEMQLTTRNITKLSANINDQFKQMPQITRSVQEILASLRIMLTDLQRTTPQLPRITKNVDDAVSNMPVLLLQTQQVMFELEQVLKQLQSSWLLGGEANAKPQPAARISPLEVRP